MAVSKPKRFSQSFQHDVEAGYQGLECRTRCFRPLPSLCHPVKTIATAGPHIYHRTIDPRNFYVVNDAFVANTERVLLQSVSFF